MTRDSPESARFGVRIARVDQGDDLAVALASTDAEVVIVRVPSSAPLPTHAGWQTIDAGELVEWRGDLADVTGPAQPLPTRDTTDAALITDLVLRIFDGYRTHYAANPRLDASLVADGYAEWARAADTAVVLWDDDEAIGIATLRTDGDPWRIELAGIVAEHRGTGRYAHLLHGIHTRARAAGITAVEIGTQAENTVVQRAWARVGYRRIGSWRTAHLVRSPAE